MIVTSIEAVKARKAIKSARNAALFEALERVTQELNNIAWEFSDNEWKADDLDDVINIIGADRIYAIAALLARQGKNMTNIAGTIGKRLSADSIGKEAVDYYKSAYRRFVDTFPEHPPISSWYLDSSELLEADSI